MHAKTLHIAFVIAGLGSGGAERVVSLIAGQWAMRGRRVMVIAFDDDQAPIFHPMGDAVRVVRLGINSGEGRRIAGLWASFRRLGALRKALAAHQPDVTISFLTKINVLTLLASLGTRRRVVVSERNNPRLQKLSRLWPFLLENLHWRADAIVMQTQGSLECLDDAARARASVIPNPVEIDFPSALPSSDHAKPLMRTPRLLAATGRLTWQKGFDMLIDAFAVIAPHHPDWTLVIWGEGEARDALQRQIGQLGLADRIRLAGNSSSPGEWLAQADAFVLSSRYEGFSNALAEAMAAGLPVVSFDCAYSPSDLIDNEINGLLVENGNVPALAAALSRLLGDAALRARLGAAARETGIRLRPDMIVKQWDDMLEAIGVG